MNTKANVNTPNIKFAKVIEALLWIAALGLLTENVVLFRENQKLRDAQAHQISVGEQLGILSASALDGHIEPLSFHPEHSKLVVFTFAPGCPACQVNQPSWTRLADALEKKGIRTLWVSRDAAEMTKVYCARHGIPISRTVADPTHRIYLQLGLARVPNTILVTPEGQIEKVWPGALDETAWNSLFAYFGERRNAPSSAPTAVSAVTAPCGNAANAFGKNCDRETNTQ